MLDTDYRPERLRHLLYADDLPAAINEVSAVVDHLDDLKAEAGLTRCSLQAKAAAALDDSGRDRPSADAPGL